MPLLKLPFEAIISAKHVPITYTFVDNLPLTNVLLINRPSSRTTIQGQGTYTKIWMFEKTILI